jgi:glycosyltransferase involved in cell wall biosynthesis
MKQRIVIVCNALRIGGSQSVIRELVRIATNAGYEVTVASGGGVLEQEIERAGATHIRLTVREGVAVGDRRGPVSAVKTVASLVGVAQLVAACRGASTLIHASQPWPVAAAAVAALVVGRPLVWHAHGTTAVEMPPAGLSLVRRASAAWIAITPEVADALHALKPRPRTVLTTIPSPIDLKFPGDERASPREGVVGVVSTLTPNKLGYVLACLDAASSLAAKGLKVHLRILGDGPARSTVERAAQEAQGSEPNLRVSLHPSSTAPWKTLRDAEVVVGMGLVALEAVVRGHNVVCASSDGLGGRLSMGTYPLLQRTNFTGRGVRPLNATVLADDLHAAFAVGPESDVDQHVRAAHGASAAAGWTALWRSLLP